MIVREDCPPDSFEWLQAIRSQMDHRNEELLRICVYGCKVVEFITRCRRLIDRHDDRKLLASLPEIANQLDELDSQEVILLLGGDTHTIDLDHLNAENTYSAYRIRAHFEMLHLLQYASQPAENMEYNSLISVRQMSSIIQARQLSGRIISSLPYLLGPDFQYPNLKMAQDVCTSRSQSWSDGIRLLNPLRIIQASPIWPEQDRKITSAALQFLSEQWGFRHATSEIFSGVALGYQIKNKQLLPSEHLRMESFLSNKD